MTKSGFDGGSIMIDNILLVSPDQKEIKPSAYEYSIGDVAPQPTPSGASTLSVEDFTIAAGETRTMTIELNNPDDELTLVQFDLHLPKGLTVKKTGGDLDIDMCDRTTWRKHTLDANEVDGAVRFLLYSSSNTLISDSEGGIIEVTLTADDTFDGGSIVIDNILLVSPDQKEIKPSPVLLTISSPNTIAAVESGIATEIIYGTDGLRRNSLQKGINIVNGKKVLVK